MQARRKLAVLATVALPFTACGGDDEVTTVTVEDRQDAKRLKRFAYAEMKRQARKTCEVVPREVLVRSFRAVSGDRESYTGRPLTPNDIGLMFAETVRINPIPLARAAYDGCIQGIKRQR